MLAPPFALIPDRSTLYCGTLVPSHMFPLLLLSRTLFGVVFMINELALAWSVGGMVGRDSTFVVGLWL